MIINDLQTKTTKYIYVVIKWIKYKGECQEFYTTKEEAINKCDELKKEFTNLIDVHEMIWNNKLKEYIFQHDKEKRVTPAIYQ